MKPTYLALLAGLFAAGVAHAQLKGKVVEISTNSDTTVVPGVVVNWENSPIVSTTDENGNFTIPFSTETKKLKIQSLGFEKQSFEIKDTSKFLLVSLKSGLNLNEVEIVYLSSGTEISYLNPIKMEILNERSLIKAACCNLSESFETNPSVEVNFSDAISGAKQIQMLGLSGQYAQITKENMPYLRGLANNYGLMFIPGTWIQSIQLSKGAGSVINGYESFTGQINTELQNPEKSDKLNFNTYVNENGRNEYNLNLSRRLNQKWAVGLLNHVSFNPLVQDYNQDRFADIPTGRQYNFMNKYAYNNPNNGFEAQFGGAYLKDERKGGQFAELLPNNYPGFPPFEISLNNEKWEVYSKTGYVFKKNPGTSMGLQLSYLDHDQNNSFDTSGYRGRQKTFYANYIYQGIMGNTSNTYKIGASYLNDDVKENYKMSHYYRNESVAGVFVEYAKNYKEKFNMVAGLRADHHNFYGLFFTPRLHLRYAITPNNVLRLSVGKALRTANVFADNASLMATSRVWSIETSDLSMPYGLKPESAWNYGINFTKKFKINYREAYVTLDAYRTDFVNQIVTDVDNNAQKVLIYNLNGSSYSNTFQFEFNVEPRKRLFVKTAYRFVDTKMTYKEGLLQKPLVSVHRAFINFSYETKNSHWQFDFTTQYNGSKRLPGTETNPIEYQRANFSPDYFNLLGQITYLTNIKNADFNIYLGVENLLNYKQTNPIVAADVPRSKYFDASMIWGPVYGRMLYLGLRLKIK